MTSEGRADRSRGPRDPGPRWRVPAARRRSAGALPQPRRGPRGAAGRGAVRVRRPAEPLLHRRVRLGGDRPGLRGENRVIAIHGERRFLGELGIIIGQRLYLTCVVREPSQVIQLPLERLFEIVAQDKGLSDMILGAFMARRSILIGVGTGMKLIGSRFSPDSRQLREFLARNRMPYQWIDLEPTTMPRHCSARSQSRRARRRWWSRATARSCATRTAPSWDGRSASARPARPRTYAMSSSLAPDPQVWQPGSMPLRRAWTSRASKRSRLAARPEPRPGSRTTLASLRASRGLSSHSAPPFRRRSSGRG